MLNKSAINLIKDLGGDEEEIREVERLSQKMAVGDEVTILRESMGLNESAFATILGISPTELHKIEEGDFEADPQITLTKIQEAVETYKNL